MNARFVNEEDVKREALTARLELLLGPWWWCAPRSTYVRDATFLLNCCRLVAITTDNALAMERV